jgi:carbon-monoxide dehydrogenase medium subunit
MIPAAFEYVRAKSLAEARALLKEHGDDAKLLAGGHSLIPMMKLRLAQPKLLIDIARVPGLASIEAGRDKIAIGALVRHATLAASDALRDAAPALWDAANELGDAQVRNRGTIGGACAHGDPLADYPAVMLALDATFSIDGATGREVGASEFFRGMFATALEGADVLTQIAFAPAPCSAYVKLHHPASHYAVVGVAAKLTVREDTIAAAAVAVTGAGYAPFRAAKVEQALAGVCAGDQEKIRAACSGAAEGIELRVDQYASAEYRAAMADVFAERAVMRALGRARAGRG